LCFFYIDIMTPVEDSFDNYFHQYRGKPFKSSTYYSSRYFRKLSKFIKKHDLKKNK